MTVLKLAKGLFYAFCVLVILLCSLVIWAAFSPAATERLANILYGENEEQGILDVADGTDPQQPEGDGDNQLGGLFPQESPEPTTDPLQESPEPTIAPPQMDGPLIWVPKDTPQPVQTQPPDSSSDIDPNGMVINIYVAKDNNVAAATNYVIPASDSVTAPSDLADKVGYTPVTDDTTEINTEEINKLLPDLTFGETGTAVYLDSLFYPYYYMLDETGQAI